MSEPAEFLALALVKAAPLIFAALAGVLCERAGILNIALEGQLAAGAFVAVAAAAATGNALATPSDNPVNYVTVMNDSSKNLQYTTYLSNIQSATSDLNAGVAALTNIQTAITQATSTVQQGINASTDTAALPALADQINSLIGTVAANLNSQNNGRYIFSGTNTGTPPYSVTATDTAGEPTAISYSGSNEQAQTLIGPGQAVSTLYSGASIVQQPGTDLFQTLINIRDALNNPSLSQSALASTLTAQMSTLQQAGTNVESAIGEQSSSLQYMSTLQSQVQQLQTDNQTATSNLQSTNFAQAIVQMTDLQTTFQATLASSAKIFSYSLLNYLQ